VHERIREIVAAPQRRVRGLKSSRVASGRSSASSAERSSRPSTPVASTTVAGPTSTSSGRLSAAAAPSKKCSGASMCVPEWTPKSSRLTFATAPSAIAVTRSRCTVGSPGYMTIPSRIGTVMSSSSMSSSSFRA
jgi:hypothetical protein